MPTPTTLSDEALALPLTGSGLGGARTVGELAAEPVFLAFLRHGGWLFAREWVAELRRARERHPALPRIVLVHQGDLEQGARLVEARWPGAAAVSDPGLALYRAFDLEQGTLGQIMGLAAVRSGLRAMRKGHFPGVPVGDVRVLPGIFLVHGREVLWSRRFEHSGQLPEEAELLEAARALAG